MTQIASVDWVGKRFHLHLDTTVSGFDAWEAFTEVRTLIELNANNEQNHLLFIHRQGKFPKNSGRFTPKFVSFNSGWRAVPYSLVAHELNILTEMVSVDELTDKDMFDRSTVLVNVDIDSVYEDKEIVVISTGGSALTVAENAKLMGLPSAIENKDELLGTESYP